MRRDFGHAVSGRGPKQDPSVVAEAIADCIDHPRAEVYTNPTVQLEMVKRYYEDVGAFEERMGR